MERQRKLRASDEERASLQKQCEAAVAHGYRQTGALEAEVCTLRRPQGALELLPQLQPDPAQKHQEEHPAAAAGPWAVRTISHQHATRK